ncbi:MAG: hypothetical protein K5764_03460 [Prevotella sp.]|nr:hypothetical protein [Prevotella sp.]
MEFMEFLRPSGSKRLALLAERREYKTIELKAPISAETDVLRSASP